MTDENVPMEEEGAEIQIIRLEDDEGNELDFGLMGMVEVRGMKFAILAPYEQIDDDDEDADLEMIILHFEETEDSIGFRGIEDDELYEEVQAHCLEFLNLEEPEIN